MNSNIAGLDRQKIHEKYLASTLIKAELPELSAEEKKRPLAKYFYDEIPEPDPKVLQIMDKPCDPTKAITPEQMNDLLNPGDLDVEIGWCNLANGTGFLANRNVYPEITAEMIDWWFAWHPLEDLRYRIWYPPQHAGIMVEPEHRAQLLDTSIPFKERNWGVVHHVIEDTNCGMETIDIHFMSPHDFGFDMNRWKEPNVSTFSGGQGWSSPVHTTAVHTTDQSISSPTLMCHIFRQTNEGLEHRTRFWLGYHFVDGKPAVALPPGVSVPAPVIQGLARHNVYEFTRLKEFLPKIYREFGGEMTVCTHP